MHKYLQIYINKIDMYTLHQKLFNVQRLLHVSHKIAHTIPVLILFE